MIKKHLNLPIGIFLVLVLVSFASQDRPHFEIKGTAKSKNYGYSESEPIKVGGGTSAGYHFMFLEQLRGPNGETLEVSRIGSCGNYPDPDTTLTKFKEGVLTCFSINCPAFKKPRTLYFDKYRTGDLYLPKDLTWKD